MERLGFLSPALFALLYERHRRSGYATNCMLEGRGFVLTQAESCWSSRNSRWVLRLWNNFVLDSGQTKYLVMVANIMHDNRWSEQPVWTGMITMRQADPPVYIFNQSKRIASHEKYTTVAWGNHKDVIIDIIIKTIIIQSCFTIYNYSEWWKHLSVFSINQFMFTGPCGKRWDPSFLSV